FEWCDAWLAELYRVLKPGCTLAVLNIPLWAVRHYQKLATLMQFQSWIVWEALGLPVRMIMPSHYALLCFSKGEPRPLPGFTNAVAPHEKTYLQPLGEGFCVRASCETGRRQVGISDTAALGDIWSDIHRLKHNSRRVDHPCQLPPHLLRRLFALFTKPNEIVLDCFNGAGTSTLVAVQMNRRYIGIEHSEQYHNLALQRHHQYECGQDPFEKTESVPQAKNSRVPRMPTQKYLVSKKQLQLEVRRIAKQVGRLPTKEDVKAHSAYSLEYFEKYFSSWGEVCAAARTTGMSELPTSQLSLDVF
ncbi:MAG: DNA methyltransferase, partial [Armatimonadetes bacterium]|nr:DNA methyltransferase [Armatimonadota bacterium]